LSFHPSLDPPLLPSFPTRRSSDLPYDVVLDFDRDGWLSTGDWIDGSDAEAGFYVLYPTTHAGPLAVTELVYSGGTWLGQDLFYQDRKSTRLNSSHVAISYAVFCLK